MIGPLTLGSRCRNSRRGRAASYGTGGIDVLLLPCLKHLAPHHAGHAKPRKERQTEGQRKIVRNTQVYESHAQYILHPS